MLEASSITVRETGLALGEPHPALSHARLHVDHEINAANPQELRLDSARHSAPGGLEKISRWEGRSRGQNDEKPCPARCIHWERGRTRNLESPQGLSRQKLATDVVRGPQQPSTEQRAGRLAPWDCVAFSGRNQQTGIGSPLSLRRHLLGRLHWKHGGPGGWPCPRMAEPLKEQLAPLLLPGRAGSRLGGSEGHSGRGTRCHGSPSTARRLPSGAGARHDSLRLLSLATAPPMMLPSLFKIGRAHV